jgi:hypothetical protein
MPSKEEGAVLTIHQSCDRKEGEDKDGQRGYIIGPSWVLHLPAALHAPNRVYKTYMYLISLFCDWGR